MSVNINNDNLKTTAFQGKYGSLVDLLAPKVTNHKLTIDKPMAMGVLLPAFSVAHRYEKNPSRNCDPVAQDNPCCFCKEYFSSRAQRDDYNLVPLHLTKGRMAFSSRNL